jgi:hypothetical protein
VPVTIPVSEDRAFGTNVDAEMFDVCNSIIDRKFSNFSAESNVSSTKEFVVKNGVSFDEDTQVIFDSLLWPFLCRKGPFKSQKEFGRFQRSALKMACSIQFYQDQDKKDNGWMIHNYVQDVIKYHNDVILCRYARDRVLPERPPFFSENHRLYTGYMKNFIDRRVLKFDLSFCYSLQKGTKQAWPELGLVKKFKALHKHSKRLSRERTGIPEDLKKNIGIVSRETFRYIDIKSLTKCLPSASACYELGRKDKGCLGLFDQISPLASISPEVLKIQLRRTKVVSLPYFKLEDEEKDDGSLFSTTNRVLPGHTFQFTFGNTIRRKLISAQEATSVIRRVQYPVKGVMSDPRPVCSPGPDVWIHIVSFLGDEDKLNFNRALLFRRKPDVTISLQHRMTLNLHAYRADVFEKAKDQFLGGYDRHLMRLDAVKFLRSLTIHSVLDALEDSSEEEFPGFGPRWLSCMNGMISRRFMPAPVEFESFIQREIISLLNSEAEDEDGGLGSSDHPLVAAIESPNPILFLKHVHDPIFSFEKGPIRGVNDVKVVAIPEPGKFRIISKGNGFMNTFVQPLQGAMIDCLKRQKWSTMKHADLTEKVNKIHLSMGSDCKEWRSVDYEAATDLLNIECTEACVSGLPRELQDTMSKAFNTEGSACLYDEILTDEHYVEMPGWDMYKNVMDGTIFKNLPNLRDCARELNVPLSNGQLMGHCLSFPLLCVVNRAVYLTAVDRYLEQKYGFSSQAKAIRELRVKYETGNKLVPTIIKKCLKEMRDAFARTYALAAPLKQKLLKNLIVNGDDMLFKPIDKLFCDIFSQVAKEAGFKSSQGKDYLSEHLAMINSQVF